MIKYKVNMKLHFVMHLSLKVKFKIKKAEFEIYTY